MPGFVLKEKGKNDHNAADKNAFSHACESVLKIQFPGCNGDLSGEMAEGVANYRLLEEEAEKIVDRISFLSQHTCKLTGIHESRRR